MLSSFLVLLTLAGSAVQFPEKATEGTGVKAAPASRPAVARTPGSLVKTPAQSDGKVLRRPARPGIYFDAVGNRSFVCGTEDGPIEAWIWPYQILVDGGLAFRPKGSLDFVKLDRYATEIVVEPHATTLRYRSADLFADVTFFCPDETPAVVMLLTLEADAPGTLQFSFTPKLQPQWPASVGGVAGSWNADAGAFLLSEPSARVAAAVGSPWASAATEGMQYLLPNGALRFEMAIEPGRCQQEFLPIVLTLAEGAGCVEEARRAFVKVSRDSVDTLLNSNLQWDEALSNLTSVRVIDAARSSEPAPDVERAFLWNAVSLRQGLVRSSSLGDGLVAGYGPAGLTSQRPGFAWFFTGDVSVNAPAYLAAGLEETLAVGLRFAAKHQRSDGKIPHEVVLSAHLCEWFDKYPFAYIHGETTGLWIHACQQYLDQTGDRRFLAEAWPAIRRAYRWILAQDLDGDGLPENSSAGMGASEIGELRRNLKTDIYLASASAIALRDVSRMAAIAGDKTLTDEAMQRFEKARRAIAEGFWDAAEQSYAHALLTDGTLSKERTVWPAYAVALGLVEGERAVKTMDFVKSVDLTTDWGVRFLSKGSKHFDPKGYNQGTVWPFVTGLAALANFRVGFGDSGFRNVKSVMDLTFAEALGRTPEVLSGARPRSLDTSVPHQLFSSMAVCAPLVYGLVGYEPDAFANRIVLRPCFPASWGDCELSVRRLHFMGKMLDVTLTREGTDYRMQLKSAEGIDIELRPRDGGVASRPGR
jgi:glycogen debranching enzyme